MPDKRDECGCHRTCSLLEHSCEVPCVWPSCLTELESRELVRELLGDEGTPST